MAEQVVHVIPAAPTARDYFIRLYEALLNREDNIIFSKATIRNLYKQAYPKAKV